MPTQDCVREWRIHVWIVLPSVLPMPNGKFPEKWQTIDIFPEIKIYQDKDTKIYLRKNHHSNRKQSNYLLETKIMSKGPEEALDLLGEKIETLVDSLFFQLQTPIPITFFEIVDFTKPLKKGEERQMIFANSLPRVQKDSGFNFMHNWTTSINIKLFEKPIDENTEAALRWYSKGLSSHPIVDQFTFFWIALEILTLPIKHKKRIYFQCRKCGYQIELCPKCSYSTLHFPSTKERIESFVTDELGNDKNVFKELWETRMIFHGRNKLTSDEINKIPDMTWKLRLILVDAIKRKLGLTEQENPKLVSLDEIIIMDKFILGGRRQITELDIKYDELV
jgi:hypothetical protein